MANENQCSELSGKVVPAIDRNKCEGKEDCVRACPFDVFAIGKISAAEKAQLSFFGKIKAWAHGGKQAFVVNPESCHACNLCVTSCPEKAIKLVSKKC